MALDERWETITPKLEQNLISAIKVSFGFETMMPVQKSVIPLFLSNYDVAVEVKFFHSLINFDFVGRDWFRKNISIFNTNNKSTNDKIQEKN